MRQPPKNQIKALILGQYQCQYQYQDSILGPLIFLIYINDLSDNLQCNLKLFTDDTSLPFTVKVPEKAANILNTDLKEILEWAFQ